jgi:hypothetical protein
MLAVIIMIITIIMMTMVIVVAVGVECTIVACEGGEGKGRWVQGVGRCVPRHRVC